MCGILLEILFGHNIHPCCQNEKLSERLHARGPDSRNSLITSFDGQTFLMESNDIHDVCYEEPTNKTYLHFIGHVLQTQGSALASQPLIGDNTVLLFNGDLFQNDKMISESSDSLFLRDKLEKNSESAKSQRELFILSTLRKLRGPFCIIYLDKLSSKLYFTRDRIGRHSLLIDYSKSHITLASVLGRHYVNTIEVSADNIYSIDLNDLTVTSHDWENEDKTIHFDNVEQFVNTKIREKVQGHAITKSYLPSEENSSLIETINRIADASKDNNEFMSTVLKIEEVQKITDKIIALLLNSVKIRVSTQPFLCKLCKNGNCNKDTHATVAILFSGGLDCSLLAVLAAMDLPEYQQIDLLNVAFESKSSESFDVPDRLTALQTLNELRSLFPQRLWNLVEINVTKKELYMYQNEVIADLVFPLKSILDESLGSALWFAARGQNEKYQSPSRILLMGSGADEIFGGYNKHRVTFRRNGWSALGSELDSDWNRISYRNLARDSRVIGHHGRQARFPYLDEDFLEFVLQLKPWNRCLPSDSCKKGWGEKLFLRLAAYKLGLHKASCLEKRAIQFGSRIANKNENANDVSPRLAM